MASFTKQVKVNDRKKVSVTSWKGKVWLHVRDNIKETTVSFTKVEFLAFLERLDKIQKYIKQCESSIKKGRKVKAKKTEESSSSEMSFAGDSDSE